MLGAGVAEVGVGGTRLQLVKFIFQNSTNICMASLMLGTGATEVPKTQLLPKAFHCLQASVR